ncbi:MAG: hypothetical protein KC501_02640 [Myxococcales bacterium]|nr:hypothetical protein [Myxococcales bacterium]
MRAPGVSAAWLALLLGCGGSGPDDGGSPAAGEAASSAPAAPVTVGYDLRRLRPVNDQPLEQMFERLLAQAQAEGKQVAVLFSANWCERCRRLELELGSLHPAGDIAHVRILELVEEDWEAVTRMNEFDALRLRWDQTKGTYPLLVVLDDQGGKVEEMKEAIDRLEQAGAEATLPTWFRGLRRS